LIIAQEEEEVTAEFLAGKVPEIVYKKAVECIPGTGNSIYMYIDFIYINHTITF